MNQYYSLPMYFGAHPMLFKLAKKMRLAPTEAEERMWQLLNQEIFKAYKFRRQHPLAEFIADFYCHQFSLVIEVDGGVHRKPEQMQYDIFRDEDMAEYGIKVLRVTNNDVLENETEVIRKIKEALNEID